MMIIQGNADRLISFEEVEAFVGKVRRKGNLCEYVCLDGRDNNFYNMNFDPVSFEICLRDIDTFFVKGGLIEERESEEPIRIISWREQDF